MAKEPTKYVMRKIKRKNGGTYERKVLSEEYKMWRKEEEKRLKYRTKYYKIRKELIIRTRESWKQASYWDRKTEKMIYYKDIMTFNEFIEMRMKNITIK